MSRRSASLLAPLARLAGIFFACAWPAAPALAQDHAEVRIRTDEDGTTAIRAVLLKPEGSGPFAAVVALHGCGGLRKASGELHARHADWGDRLRAERYVVLFPDSYGSRGHGSLCSIRNRPVRNIQRVRDAAAAADWLAAQPFVDPDRLALIGWSQGGTTLLRALEPGHGPAGADFRAAVAFYPGCRSILEGASWTPRLRPLILIGAADDWTPAEPCRKLAEKWSSRFVAYEGAYHGFDTPDSPLRRRSGVAYSADGSGTVFVGTDQRAREAAIAEVMQLLAGALRAKE